MSTEEVSTASGREEGGSRMREAWVDFNDVHDGRTTTLRKFVETGVEVYVGRPLMVGDYDGNLCHSTVTDLDGDIVEVALDLETFTSVSRAHAVNA